MCKKLQSAEWKCTFEKPDCMKVHIVFIIRLWKAWEIGLHNKKNFLRSEEILCYLMCVCCFTISSEHKGWLPLQESWANKKNIGHLFWPSQAKVVYRFTAPSTRDVRRWKTRPGCGHQRYLTALLSTCTSFCLAPCILMVVVCEQWPSSECNGLQDAILGASGSIQGYHLYA